MKEVIFTDPKGSRMVKVGGYVLPLDDYKKFTQWVKTNFGKKAKVGYHKFLLEVWMNCVR